MRVLIAGATGFIGRRLVSELTEAGDTVLAVARRSDHGLACRTTVVADPLDPATYRALMAEGNIDAVVNLLAAGVHPQDRDPERLLAANTVFPARLALAAADCGVSAFVQIGSSAEYAPRPDAGPIPETAALETSRLYGATKAAGSLLVQAAAGDAGLPTAVLRAFNIFGPGEKPHRLFPALVGKLARREPVPLSAGTQVRDFLYVDDACAAIRRMAYALAAGEAAPGVYNLAGGEPVTVAAFAVALAETLHADRTLLRFGELPMRPDELAAVTAATEKLDRAIGPARRIDLREALAEGVRALLQETNC